MAQVAISRGEWVPSMKRAILWCQRFIHQDIMGRIKWWIASNSYINTSHWTNVIESNSCISLEANQAQIVEASVINLFKLIATKFWVKLCFNLSSICWSSHFCVIFRVCWPLEWSLNLCLLRCPYLLSLACTLSLWLVSHVQLATSPSMVSLTEKLLHNSDELR